MDTEPSPTTPITSEVVNKWRAHMCAIPLPPHRIPTGGVPLENVSKEALLRCPPHMIAHVQRTASQGGLQIVSPRQCPISATMIRRSGTVRMLGDHDVFSKAEREPEWPTLYDDADEINELLLDEPMPPMEDFYTKREKTRTKSLVTHEIELTDPVISCLVKGRATIDILNRQDVGGDGDAMAELLAEAWGVELGDIMDLGAYTLGVEGPLQRHAMKSDEVFPLLYAPIQSRSCITVGNVDTSKELLLEDMAIDWRRCRVFCESVFYNACSLEGIPLRAIGITHNASASGSIANSDNVLTFTPAPSISWTYSPDTFALMPKVGMENRRRFTIPEDVRNALQIYVKKVRPVSYVLSKGAMPTLKQTRAERANIMTGETIATAYAETFSSMSTGPVRGRTSSAAVRNAIYVALDGAPTHMKLRITRYIRLASQECEKHLSLKMVPDEVIRHLAYRFLEIGGTIRAHLVREAEQRGSDITSWWNDICSQVPMNFQSLAEGTYGWSMVAFWLLFRQPTDRWDCLQKAMTYKAFRSAELTGIGCMALPAEKGSGVRLVAAARATIASMTSAYYGYYKAVADVGVALAEYARANGKTRTAEILIMGARCWDLRARCLRSSNVHPIAHDEAQASTWHFRVKAKPVDLLLKPAPYEAFKSWQAHMRKFTVIPTAMRNRISGPIDCQISKFFKEITQPIFRCLDSTVTRYLNYPVRMGEDLEKSWGYLVTDMTAVAAKLCEETVDIVPSKRLKPTIVTSVTLYTPEVIEEMSVDGEQTYWDLAGMMDPDIFQGIEEKVYRLPEGLQIDIMESSYQDVSDLFRKIDQYEEEVEVERAGRKETVR